LDPGAGNYQGYVTEPGWLDGWSYRKRLQLSNDSGKTLGEYPVRILAHWGAGTDSQENVYLNGRCRSDFKDLRFTSTDSRIVYEYWAQTVSEGSEALIWIEIPSLSPSEETGLYCYYGNAAADSLSDGEGTFLLFDDFLESSIDSEKWIGDTDSAGGGWSVSAGAACCSSLLMTVFTKRDFLDVECLARMKIEAASIGYLAVRGTDHTVPFSSQSRYGLFLNAENTPSELTVALRKRVTGIETDLDTDSWTAYDYGYVAASIGAAGDNLSAEAESSTEKSILSAKDSAHSEGRVSFGTGSTVAGTVWIDWIAIRPLASPEPSYVLWGDEESE
jgi:hypothetical protein